MFQPLKIPSHLKRLVKRTEHTYSISPSLSYQVDTYSVVPVDKNGKILRRGPDDETFVLNKELIPLIPRGCSDLLSKHRVIAQLRGLPKFDGTSSIDEDEAPFEGATEQDIAAQTSTITDMALVKQWNEQKQLQTQFTEKANGKFAIAMLVKDEAGNVLLFGGSKNVHAVILIGRYDQHQNPPQNSNNSSNNGNNSNSLVNSNHSVNYSSSSSSSFQWVYNKHKLNSIESRQLHYEILEAIAQDIRQLDDPMILIGKTIIGEYVDGKHLVYTETPYMVYFDYRLPACFRKPKMIAGTVTGLPDSNCLQFIRNQTHLEGVVINYINITTGEIMRQKHKTVWYIVLRCWREIISRKRKESISPKDLTRLLCNRLKERSNQFLNLSQDKLQYWFDLAEQFVLWLTKSTQYEYSDVGPFSNVGMAKIWYEFELAQKQSTLPNDNDGPHDSKEKEPIEHKHEQLQQNELKASDHQQQQQHPRAYLIQPDLFETVIALATVSQLKLVVIMQGVSGCGKSSVARRLMGELSEKGISCSVFSTDDYFVNPQTGQYRHDPSKLGLYHQRNFEAFQKSNAQVRIVDNTNLLKWEYAKYIKECNTSTDVMAVILSTQPPDDLQLCAKRNAHGVPLKVITTMRDKYITAIPAFVGVFFNRTQVLDLVLWIDQLENEMMIDHSDLAEQISQCKPLHETRYFIGQNAQAWYEFCNRTPSKSNESQFGDTVTVSVIGYSCNEAGIALITNSWGDIKSIHTSDYCDKKQTNQSRISHITLHTNQGFNAVMVGNSITHANSTILKQARSLKGVFAASFV